jgi:guanine deaminase
MDEAVKESLLAATSKDGHPFGCVIVKNDEIIARGHNSIFKNCDPTSHAEVLAIR